LEITRKLLRKKEGIITVLTLRYALPKNQFQARQKGLTVYQFQNPKSLKPIYPESKSSVTSMLPVKESISKQNSSKLFKQSSLSNKNSLKLS